MRHALPAFLAIGLAAAVPALGVEGQLEKGASPQYRTLDDRFAVRRYSSLPEWQRRAAYLREHVLASAGLMPMPEKTPLRAEVFDEQKHDDYSVSKVYFESRPGFFVTGNLYRPVGAGPFPAILSPHGHWAYGRLENTELASVPGRAISLARQGFVVFSHDMVGYNDSRQLTHAFGGKREGLWGLSLAGLQLWNSIRSLDFLQSRPDVDPERIGCTGASGGGTQTFLLAAVDERVKVVAPVNMISLHMQGGCLCENPPGLRLDTNNVELGATIAPRPLLMVSATGDWTAETPQLEYPEMRTFYGLFGAEDHLHAVQLPAEHNYNRESREAVYAWMARWLQDAPADVHIVEKPFRPDPLPRLLVFHGRPLPDRAVTAEQLTAEWIGAAQTQLRDSDPRAFRSALLHALALEIQGERPRPAGSRPAVVLASDNPALRRALARAGFTVRPVSFTPYDAEAAAKIAHFETYNRTPASQRVADIARALGEAPGAALVADGDAALAGLLALAVAPVGRAILDVGQFDNSSDAAYVERLYVPGLRRAGDLRTAVAMARGEILVHNAGGSFSLPGSTVERHRLSVQEIVKRLRAGQRGPQASEGRGIEARGKTLGKAGVGPERDERLVRVAKQTGPRLAGRGRDSRDDPHRRGDDQVTPVRERRQGAQRAPSGETSGPGLVHLARRHPAPARIRHQDLDPAQRAAEALRPADDGPVPPLQPRQPVAGGGAHVGDRSPSG